MKSPNRPLTRDEVQNLPRRIQTVETDKDGRKKTVTYHDGFTPTSVGYNRSDFRARPSLLNTTNNRARTKGRVLQYIPIYNVNKDLVDKAGNAVRRFVKGFKKLWHKDHARLMNI